MRKVMKRKRRSCAMCKPNKTGGEMRWTPQERASYLRDFKEIRDATR